MKNTIVVVGSLNMDLVIRSPHHPKAGETILGHNFCTYPGGKGANQAIAAARLGGSVYMIGRVGNDKFGEALRDNLQKNDVNTEYIFYDSDKPTGIALITVNDIGENTIIVDPGSNWNLTPEDVELAEKAFEAASVLLVQLEIPISTVLRAMQMAKKHNVCVILNPAPGQPLSPDLLKNIDYLVPNQTELAILSRVEGNADLTQSLHQIGLNDNAAVVVTMGEAGALVVDRGGINKLPPHHVNVVDTTAAGDAFVAAFAIALTEGRSLGEAASWGNAAGAITVTRPGAQSSLPFRQEVEALLYADPRMGHNLMK